MVTTEGTEATEATGARRSWLDDRGVVAVSGLAMAVFMTAVVYYEIGVGDAITFKEQLQDASDASGFAAAVYHARGMNMIVLLNLIMAAVLAVIVILRVLEMLFGIVAALVPAICWIPGMEWLCPLEGVAISGVEWAQTTAETMDPIVRTALKGLNDVSTAVAVGMPWVALVKSGTVGVQYYPQVTSQKGGGTIMLSMSLVPDVTWIPAVSNAANEGKSGIKGAVGLPGEEGGKLDGKRWGLPVQEGEFNDLCSQAAQVVPDLIEWAINAAVHGNPNSSPPLWLTWLNKTIGALVGSFPEYFCDEGTINGPSNDIQNAAQQQCIANQKSWNQCVTQLATHGTGLIGSVPPGGGPLNPGRNDGPCANGVGDQVIAQVNSKSSLTYDMKGCLASETDKLNKEASTIKQTLESTLPKATYTWAANGNDYFAIWAFGWGNFKNQEEQGVSIARWSKDGITAPNPQHVTMLTKAEFFYAVENPCKSNTGQDSGTPGSAALCGTSLDRPYWGDYQGDTTWNPRWKARLRRVSPPMIPIGQMASSGVTSLLGGALSKGFGMIPGIGGAADGAGADWLKEFITGFIQIGGGEADGAIAGEIEKAAGYEH